MAFLFAAGPAVARDFDGDGTPDNKDLCPRTTDLAGPIPTSGVLCDGCIGDDTTLLGCNPSQILDSRIHQVRIVDDTNQGDQSGPPVGADIDSVEAVRWPYAP